MYVVATAVLVAVTFTAYPGYGDQEIASPREANTESRVDATTDRSLMEGGRVKGTGRGFRSLPIEKHKKPCPSSVASDEEIGIS